MENKKVKVERSAGAVVFRKQGRRILYLLLQHMRGHWAFPKGHIEEGEKPVEAARREIKEETGIGRIRFLQGYKENIRFRFQWPPKSLDAESRLKFVVFYLGQVFTRDVVISEEHKDFQWVPYEKAMKILKHKNVRELLTKAHELVTKKPAPEIVRKPPIQHKKESK
ncbi:MAG: NUDIX domain-containing protein [bacterium]|nr:NUDIX domain-containing protein [bacterium]